MKTIRTYALLALWACASIISMAQPAGNYYAAANGKKGASLKTSLSGIIENHVQRSYKELWTDFRTTDVRADGKVWDMYSCITNYTFGTDQAGNYSKEGDVYNREHSFPKSWFDDAYPMYSDLFHLYPTDGYVNGRRSNDPFGETKGEDYTSAKGFSKSGKCTFPGYSGRVFEPADEYKGDFARTYFYMVTCYEDKIDDWNSDMLDGRTYPGFSTWALNLLLKWAEQDPVSQKETKRNEAVYGIQKNRNPFIDYPGLEQYVWGSMKNVAFSYDHYQDPYALETINKVSTAAPELRPRDITGRTFTRMPRHGIIITNGKKTIR